MPRPSNTETRRAQIVQALLKVMAAKGYEKASIQAIAEVAGLTPGLIHYHFKTKQEILVALIGSINDLVRTRYEAFLEDAKTAKARLFAFIDARLAGGKGAAPAAVAAWVVIGAEAVRQPQVKREYQQSIDAQLKLLVRLIKAAQKESGTAGSGKQVKQFAAMILAAIEGAFQLSAAASDVMPRGYAAKTVKKTIENFLS